MNTLGPLFVLTLLVYCDPWPMEGGRSNAANDHSLIDHQPPWVSDTMGRSVKHNISSSGLQKWKFFQVIIKDSLWFCLQNILIKNFKYDYHSVTLSHYKTDEPKLGLLRKLWKEPWYHSPSPLTMFVVDSFRWIMKELINTDYSGAKWSAAPYGCNKYEIITTSSRPWLSIR